MYHVHNDASKTRDTALCTFSLPYASCPRAFAIGELSDKMTEAQAGIVDCNLKKSLRLWMAPSLKRRCPQSGNGSAVGGTSPLGLHFPTRNITPFFHLSGCHHHHRPHHLAGGAALWRSTAGWCVKNIEEGENTVHEHIRLNCTTTRSKEAAKF